MNSKLIGGILLVVGTTIGAGMLALPVATAQLGFLGSIVLFITCWTLMTTCSFLFLEVNLWLPANSNLISMAGATLGKAGQAIAWVFYLLLLYSIICAYIAGGADLFHYILASIGLPIPMSMSAVLFTFLFGTIVYLGIRVVDYANRSLMFGKLGALILLILLIIPFVTAENLGNGEFKHIISPTTISIVTVAFTCMMIIPSLRVYFKDDVKSLRISILVGTLIPLVCYIAWNMVILGVVPLDGAPGLRGMLHSTNSNSDLVSALETLLQNQHINLLAKFFTSICMATSFLSISLSLSDFLSDGMKVAKQGYGNILVYSATFLPPVLTVLLYPNAFLAGLKYAGISCFILMVLLPPIMVYVGRYHQAKSGAYTAPCGKLMLAILIMFGVFMLGFEIQDVF